MISQEKEILLRRLQELEKDLQEGKISRREYHSLKNQLNKELETIEAIEKIKILQGRKSEAEKPLDHWSAESLKENDEAEKQELIKKYVKTSEDPEKKSGLNLSLIGTIILALAFFFGTGFGMYFLNLESNDKPVSGTVQVNESAFPSFENTIKNVTETSKFNNTLSETNGTPATPPPSNQGDTGNTQTPEEPADTPKTGP